MSTATQTDTLDLLDLDEPAMCEWGSSRSVHGEGEVATGMTRIPCDACSYVRTGMVGDLCTARLRQMQDCNLYLVMRCQGCGAKQPITSITITPI